MKYILISFLCFLFPTAVFSQIELKIKDLKVFNINIKHDKNTIDEDLENGPCIHIICSLKNNFEEQFILHPSKSSFFVSFNFKGIRYENKVFPLAFFDNDTIKLGRLQTIEVKLVTYILLGTQFLKKEGGDYTNELLQILPTIKVLYKESDLKLESNEIINVSIN